MYLYYVMSDEVQKMKIHILTLAIPSPFQGKALLKVMLGVCADCED